MNILEKSLRDESICKNLIRRALYYYSKQGYDFLREREDLTMDVLSIMWDKRDKFKGDSLNHVYGNLYITCKLVFLKRLRKLQAERKNLSATGESMEIVPKIPSDPPLELFIAEETAEILYDAINQLNHPSRSAIKLLLDKNRHGEIADTLGLTLSHVKVIVHRDKNKLKGILESVGRGEWT
jgi:RNA polymerase sigma factor (sigma-70 family)